MAGTSRLRSVNILEALSHLVICRAEVYAVLPVLDATDG